MMQTRDRRLLNQSIVLLNFNQIRIRGLDKKIKNDTYNRGLIQCFLIYTSKMKDSNTSLTTMCPI